MSEYRQDQTSLLILLDQRLQETNQLLINIDARLNVVCKGLVQVTTNQAYISNQLNEMSQDHAENDVRFEDFKTAYSDITSNQEAMYKQLGKINENLRQAFVFGNGGRMF